MKKNLTVFCLLFAVTTAAGCTSTRGRIDLDTLPHGATVYLDGMMLGETPVQFEYDFKVPARLEIVKAGYHGELESLNEAWVLREIRKGNYTEGTFEIGGSKIKSWAVYASRKLQKSKDQQEPGKPESSQENR